MDIIFHTETYSNKAVDILMRLRDRQLQHSYSKKYKTSFAIGHVDVAPNGEVIWVVNNETVSLKLYGSSIADHFRYSKSTYARKGTDQKKIREWLAIMLKESVLSCLRYEAENKFQSFQYKERKEWIDKEWDRDNKRVLPGFSGTYTNAFNMAASNLDGDITIEDIYCFYDKLLNRKRLLKAYTRKQITKIIGAERDPFATELENIRREEIAKLAANHKTALENIAARRRIAIEEAQKKIYAEFAAIEAEEKAAYKTASEELVASLSFRPSLG